MKAGKFSLYLGDHVPRKKKKTCNIWEEQIQEEYQVDVGIGFQIPPLTSNTCVIGSHLNYVQLTFMKISHQNTTYIQP